MTALCYASPGGPGRNSFATIFVLRVLVEARDLALAAKLPSTAIAMEAVILLMIAELDRRPSRYSLRLSSLVAC